MKEKEMKGKYVVVMEGYKYPEESEINRNNIREALEDYSFSCDSLEIFDSAEEAFCHELASNYYDPKTETKQYKGLADAFMNEDHLIDESVIMETVEAFKQL